MSRSLSNKTTPRLGAGTETPRQPLHARTVVRLRRLCDVVSATLLLVLTLSLLGGALGWEPASHSAGLAAAVAMILLTLLMSGATRVRRIPKATLDLLGLVYQVSGAFLISSMVYPGELPLEPNMLHLSWLAVWILVIPLFVPVPLGKNLAASLLSASSAPCMYLIAAQQSGGPIAPISVLAHAFLPNYACALLAVITGYLAHDWTSSLAVAERTIAKAGSYRLVEQIGVGGMGEVWRAEHALLRRPAAVKLIRPELLSTSDEGRAAAIARFEREAQAMASLSSDHTVRLFDYGVARCGTFFYVMELLDGVDLQRLVDRTGPMSPERVVFLLCQICDSIAEAHNAGLVHRDLNPSNVLICRNGILFDVVKVLDFGLVAWAGELQGCEPGSEEGSFIGTPAYMAPEQVEFLTEVDPRVDVYAVGCLAVWLLTGRTVFKSDTLAQAVAGHLYTRPTIPADCLRGALPPALEELILKCLEKDPQRRFADAQELLGQLATIPLSLVWTRERAQTWWEQHPPSQFAEAQ